MREEEKANLPLFNTCPAEKKVPAETHVLSGTFQIARGEPKQSVRLIYTHLRYKRAIYRSDNRLLSRCNCSGLQRNELKRKVDSR